MLGELLEEPDRKVIVFSEWERMLVMIREDLAQLGIKHDDAARTLEAAGITVVQNRCTLADHQRLGLGAPARK